MIIVLFTFVSGFCFATFIRPSYALMAYIAIRLCIPHSARFGGLSLNTLVLALFVVIALPSIFNKIRKTIYDQGKYINNHIRYLTIIFFLLLISSITAVVPLDFQLTSFIQFCFTEVLPSFLFILFFFDKRDFKILNYVLAICVILTTIYSIFTFVTTTNPLYEFFSTSGDEIQENATKGRGDLLGVGVGIMNNKITTSLISLLYFLYFWNKREVVGRWLQIPILALSFAATLLTLQRSAIICLILFIGYIILYGGYKIKQLITGFTVVIVLFIIGLSYLSQYGDISAFFLSALYFWNDSYQDKMGVSGSNMEMRMTQLKTTFELVDWHLMEGLGYNYSTYFDTELNLSGSSIGEKMLGFESIVFKDITSSGLVGLFAHFLFLYRQLRLMMKGLMKRKYSYYIGFVGSYLLAIIMTDHSGTSYLFYICLALNFTYSRLYESESYKECYG